MTFFVASIMNIFLGDNEINSELVFHDIFN